MVDEEEGRTALSRSAAEEPARRFCRDLRLAREVLETFLEQPRDIGLFRLSAIEQMVRKDARGFRATADVPRARLAGKIADLVCELRDEGLRGLYPTGRVQQLRNTVDFGLSTVCTERS